MNSDGDFEEIAAEWLDAGSDLTPPHVIDAVLLAVRTTPQEPNLRIPWKSLSMRLPLYSAAAIAVLAVAGVVALNTLNRGPGVGSGPTSSPASQPTVGPTPTSAIPSGLLDDGWDPEGPDQVIEYSRNRMGVVPPSVWARIEGPRGENSGGPIGGGGGCTGGIGYPWVLKVGPADADPSTYRPILDSGGITHGTITIWIDVAPDGTVTAGKGRPEWATMEAPSNCGA